MKIAVTTRSFGNDRSNANLFETKLSPAHVKANGVRILAKTQMPGDARGSEGQSLIIPNLLMRDGLRHDVLFQATMGNVVFAFDAYTLEELWQAKIGSPVVATRDMDMWGINPQFGILSTPVIDPDKAILYCVTMSSLTGALKDADFHLHALKLFDGSAAAAPLDLSGAQYQPPDGLPLQRFNNVARKQRCALTLDKRNGVSTIFIGCGSFNENRQNQGWVIPVDVTGPAPALRPSWASTSRYQGAGIWMAGGGLAIDSNGFILGQTGNGAYDSRTEFGECFFRLAFTPASGTFPGSLECVDCWSPYTDTQLAGADGTLADISLIHDPKKLAAAADDDMVPVASNRNGIYDLDLGSAAPVLIDKTRSGFKRNLLVGSGKDGRGFVLDLDNMGKPPLAWFTPENMHKVYGCLLADPIWLTHYQPATPMPNDPSTMDVVYGGKTRHQHGNVIYWRSAKLGNMIYNWGENGNLRAWQIVELPNGRYQLKLLGQSWETASAEVTRYGGGMPGGGIALGANGDRDGVIWCSIPYGDANQTVSPGRLLAYDAEDFNADGIMPVIFDSADWGPDWQGSHNKFNIVPPINGHVYWVDYDATIRVLG